MSPDTKRRLLRYGIAADLVVVITGVALLLPEIPPGVVAILYAAAVALSAIKGGWRGGLAATAGGVIAIVAAFHATMPVAYGAGFVAFGLATTTAAAWFSKPASSDAAEDLVPPLTPVESFREDEERVAAEKAAKERAEAERVARERAEAERVAAEKAAKARAEAERAAREKAEQERIARERAEAERIAAEKAAKERAEAERVAAEKAAKARAEAERAAREKAEQERIARERAEAERVAAEKAARERAEAEGAAREKAEQERIARERAEAERVAAEKAAKERDEAERAAREKKLAEPKRGIFSGLFKREQPKPSINLRPKNLSDSATRRSQVTRSSNGIKAERKPRVLMLEKRRGTADTILPKLAQRGIEAEVVERWIDAADELFRFRPDVFFLDAELPDFDKVYSAVTQHSPSLPIVLTSRQHGSFPAVRHASTMTRPYDAEAVAALTRKAFDDPNHLLAQQSMPVEPPPPPKPQPPIEPEPTQSSVLSPQSSEDYRVTCFNCRVEFDAAEADWCSCLTKERTLVCTNCLTCFCKAPPAFKERFRIAAPPRLFERKTAELRRESQLADNPPPADVRRPLVMLVEDDNAINAIVQRVCNNLGYGYVSANNGQDGLQLARTYRPNLILSDAFMPKLDGREMCRILKEEPNGIDCKMVVMSGVYADTKYKSEALKRFHIDDYLAKPVSITDLINLLQRHLEGVSGLPQQEDLHELHRRDMDENDGSSKPLNDSYEVSCFNCSQLFDAAHAEWCSCPEPDNTLVCPHCGSCFCKAPAPYRERFRMNAPPSLFERKIVGSRRTVEAMRNPSPSEVKRPLIMLVEADEELQFIVKTVVTTMNYGYVVAGDGEEGLAMARQYNPDLILSDAFTPKLNGREMCRLLKDDPSTARVKAVIMTGLYTDRKDRNEALAYFNVDDYVAKPLAVDDLIKMVKKHLPQDVQPTM